MQTAHSKLSKSHRRQRKNEIKQLCQAFKERPTLSEKLKEQKEVDIKRLEEYETKTVEFKKAMEHGFYCIDKQKMEKEKLQKRYSELATQLKKSKFSTKQLKYFLYNL